MLKQFSRGIKHAGTLSKNAETQVTVMSNGMKVASEKRFGHFCIAGIAIQSGSRYETNYPNGVSHFIERSAFGPTNKFKSREDVAESISQYGGTIDCQGSRDTLIYAVSIFNREIEHAVDLLSETVLKPKLTPRDVEETAMRINFENQDLLIDPERKTQLSEMIHAAAYNNNTLGHKKVCPPENIDKIDSQIMFNYMKHTHTPDRMVLAGVGMEHEKLVELAQKYFVESTPIWESNPELVAIEPKTITKPKSIYTGGYNTIQADLSNVSLGPTPLPNLAHFSLGFEVCSHLELDDFVTYCVMNMLLGGGGSFSAGGPGKGMFTRLFTNVLNVYYWINSCSAHNQSYEDSGIFYIQSSSEPEQLHELVHIVIEEFKRVAYGRIGQQELARAKKQLTSMLLINLEVRPVVFEDIARQVLSTGQRRQPCELIEKIERVSEDNLRQAAQKMLGKTPAVSCLGDLTKMPSFDHIRSKITMKEFR